MAVQNHGATAMTMTTLCACRARAHVRLADGSVVCWSCYNRAVLAKSPAVKGASTLRKHY